MTPNVCLWCRTRSCALARDSGRYDRRIGCDDQETAAPERLIALALHVVAERAHVARLPGPHFDSHETPAGGADGARMGAGGADRGAVGVGTAADDLSRGRLAGRAAEAEALPV